MPSRKCRNKSIFVSSTFRDMQAERDALRDFVLPKVNEFAARYGCAVELIDLRWGVDTASVSEEEQTHKVLRTCLDEIERSRPFFIGLIGDRYGWMPPIPEMEAALGDAQFSVEDLNMSVTALEIEYGTLRSDTPPVCLFYFRKSLDYSAMPEEFCQIYQDNADGLVKLEALKAGIYTRFAADVKEYTAKVCEDGLAVSEEWADMVATDIIEKLRQEWGGLPDKPLSWQEQERDVQDAFRESRTEYFSGRRAVIDDLAAFCLNMEEGPKLLMLQSEAGSGKSGLLCKVMDKIEDKCLLLPFSCGISSRSSTAEGMLRYFISLLCETLSVEDNSEEITKFQDLKDKFVELLFAACQKTRVVAVVDALDQLADSDETDRMLWVSGKLPENFRLLCSIIDGPETTAIKRLGGEVRPVPAISREDEAAIIRGIAARHRKQISDIVVEYILQKQTLEGTQAAQNPLYLSLITQDLAMMDRGELEMVQQGMQQGFSHSEALARFMRQRIDETPGDPGGAYLAILSRLEKLMGRDFLRGVCGMIALSRNGLRESDMDGAFKELGMEFNPADFSWLRQMLRGHFAQGDLQQWDFSHQSLRRALKQDRPEELRGLNAGLAAHFYNSVSTRGDDFAGREIMHHLYLSNRPDLAARVRIVSAEVLARGLADLYTEQDGDSFLLEMAAYAKNIEGVGRSAVTVLLIMCLKFLPLKTHQFQIDLLLSALTELDGQEHPQVRWVMVQGQDRLANIYTEIGQSEKAGLYYRKSLATREQLYEQRDRLEQKEAIQMLEALAGGYAYMGDHLTTLGQVDEAGAFYNKAVAAYEKLYETRRSRTENHAPDLYEQQEIARALGKLAESYDRMGKHLTAIGRTEDVWAFYQKSLALREQIYEQYNKEDAISNLATSYGFMGDHQLVIGQTEEAGEYYRKTLAIREERYEHYRTEGALNNLAVAYNSMGHYLKKTGQLESAKEYYQKALVMREELYEQRGTTIALRDLAFSYVNMGDLYADLSQQEESMPYYRKGLDMREQVYKQSGATVDWDKLAFLYNKMGYFYEFEVGVEKDLKQAVHWYKKAAEQGWDKSQNNLGRLYEFGTGVEKDLKQAAHWYKKAAKQGHARAQYSLGYFYETGSGIEKDLEQAVHWHKKAAEQGENRAQHSLGWFYEFGKGIEADIDKAVYWYKQSANLGNAMAQYTLGYLYEFGKGVEKNVEQAIQWYKKSAGQGNARAQSSLGYYYETGVGVEKDIEQAVYWYTKSAEQGNARAQFVLGYYYETGTGVEKNIEQAVYWYTKSAEQGNTSAQYNLGLCYRSGKGVQADQEQSRYWFKKAADQGHKKAAELIGE